VSDTQHLADENDFRLRVHEEGEHTVVVLGGDVDLESGAELADGIGSAAARARNLVIDVRRVTFMDSTGIKAILAASEHVEIVVRGPGAAVRRLLQLTGADQVVGIEGEAPEPAGG
jgi:anti-sigma B factor antagonist